jgi:hypothetical protein
MSSTYLILFTVLGGALALFAAAGWSSYKEKKLPETSLLFRWFVAGSCTAGLASYAYLFGAGGDPTSMLKSVGESLELKEVVQTLTSAVSSNTEKPKPATQSGSEELKIGMPNF